jgi:hypothetical protein
MSIKIGDEVLLRGRIDPHEKPTANTGDQASGIILCDECCPNPATTEPKLVREWRYEENGYWAEYRSGSRDGRVQRRSQDCPHWYDDIQTIADMEEHVRTNPRYRETTQPAPAPVAGNVPLTLHGPASLNGKTVRLYDESGKYLLVEVRA